MRENTCEATPFRIHEHRQPEGNPRGAGLYAPYPNVEYKYTDITPVRKMFFEARNGSDTPDN
ncbi:MAG: hypothetical protein NTZ39_08660 [Methanoregula sp.]|nr:hypothetical protein [Methanoregula sp.]